jgi:uncharacterized protein
MLVFSGRHIRLEIDTAMKKLLFGSLLAFGQAFAQTPAPATIDADPALWVVKDSDTTVYLFGTFHLLNDKYQWFDEAVKTAFDAADELVVEADISDAAGAQAVVLKLGLTADGPTLREKMPKELAERFTQTMAKYGLPASAFDRFDPWFAALSLTQVQYLKMGLNPESGPETKLLTAAKSGAKTINALETVEQQLGLFDSMTEAKQLEFLRLTMKDIDEVPKVVGDMLAAWSGGDVDKLDKLLNKGLAESPELAKLLFEDRNANWAKWVADRMSKPGTVFVAVGAGHLTGKGSVQQKLAARGIKSERIKY